MSICVNDWIVISQIFLSGWWFGTCFIFLYWVHVLIPTDFQSIIFQRDRSTTNQYIYICIYIYEIRSKWAYTTLVREGPVVLSKCTKPCKAIGPHENPINEFSYDEFPTTNRVTVSRPTTPCSWWRWASQRRGVAWEWTGPSCQRCSVFFLVGTSDLYNDEITWEMVS